MSRAESMKLVKDLRKQGFTVERTGSGHWKISAPDQENSVVMAFSPSGGGRHPRLLKQLKGMGYKP